MKTQNWDTETCKTASPCSLKQKAHPLFSITANTYNLNKS